MIFSMTLQYKHSTIFYICILNIIYNVCALGFLLDFISGPVSVGFTSAAAIIIATSQVKDILGLKVTGTKFVQVWQSIFEHIGETKRWDTALGIVCIIVLLLLRVSTTLIKLRLVVLIVYPNRLQVQKCNQTILFRLCNYYSFC